MGVAYSIIMRALGKPPVYTSVHAAYTTSDPGRSIDEIFANIRTFGIDPAAPSAQDLDNLEWLREERGDVDPARIKADKARWAEQTQRLRDAAAKQRSLARRQQRREQRRAAKAAVVLSDEEVEAARLRRDAREARNSAMRLRRQFQRSRELVPLR